MINTQIFRAIDKTSLPTEKKLEILRLIHESATGQERKGTARVTPIFAIDAKPAPTTQEQQDALISRDAARLLQMRAKQNGEEFPRFDSVEVVHRNGAHYALSCVQSTKFKKQGGWVKLKQREAVNENTVKTGNGQFLTLIA